MCSLPISTLIPRSEKSTLVTFVGTGVKNILHCCQHSLQALDISWCKKLTKDSIAALRDCPNLSEVSAEGCMRFGIDGFAQLSRVSTIKALNLAASPADDFSSTPVSGYNVHGLLILGRMYQLISLDISNWLITNNGRCFVSEPTVICSS